MHTIKILKPHISLNVNNVEKSIEFYSIFGIEPVKVQPRYAKFDVQNPPLNLALNETVYSKAERFRISAYRLRQPKMF